MYVPLWGACVSGALLLIGSIVGSVVLFKNNKATVEAKRVEIAAVAESEKAKLETERNKNAGTEEANLRDDQRELILAMKENTVSYQAMVAEYGKAIVNEAKTQAALAALEEKYARVDADLTRLRTDFVLLQADRDKLLQQVACVPFMEEQLKEKDKTIKQHAQTIKLQVGQLAELHDKLDSATILLDAATRGQERAEGAVSMLKEGC